MLHRFYRLLLYAHDELRQSDNIYMVLLALLIGVIGGFSAVIFYSLIQLVQTLVWFKAEYTPEYIAALPTYQKVLVPALGLMAVAWIIQRIDPASKGHGVPGVIEAVALRGGRIRSWTALTKMLTSALTIGTGGSVGREGPIIQIGATIGSALGQWLNIDERRLKTLVGCGAAAGLAATFNAPMAGALFAVEVIIGDFAVAQFSPIVISSVAATVVGRSFLGDRPSFLVPNYSIVHWGELFVYAVLGLFAALIALLFIRLLLFAEDWFDALKVAPPLKGLAGGAILGLMAMLVPAVMGSGEETIVEALKGLTPMQILALLVFFKILAVSLTLACGGSGGVFTPSLYIGAMLGGLVGCVVHQLWPQYTAGPGAYALVGMGAVMAASTHAPITAIFIIFEMTSDYHIILPLMVSCIISTLLAQRMNKATIYTVNLLRKGVDIYAGRDVNVLRHLFVRDVMRAEFATIPPAEKLMPIMTRFIENPGSTIFVVDHNQNLLGVISINEIRPLMADAAAFENLVIAQDMMLERDFPTVGPEDNLDDVMKWLGRSRGEVAVVENGRIIGAIWPEDVIERYNAEIFKRDMAYGMTSKVDEHARYEALSGVEGMSIAELKVPASFYGKSLAELDLGKKFEVSVLLIKRNNELQQETLERPNAATRFQQGDVMLALGPNKKLRSLEKRG